MKSDPKLSKARIAALVRATAGTPCFCAVEDFRVHDGRCISCWALQSLVYDIRRMLMVPSETDGYFMRRQAGYVAELDLRELHHAQQGLPLPKGWRP